METVGSVFAWIGVVVVGILAAVGFFCMTGIGVHTGPGYVAVGYTTPTCYSNCYGGGGAISRQDRDFLQSVYKNN